MNKVFAHVLLGMVVLAGVTIYMNGQYAAIRADGIEAAKAEIVSHIQARAEMTVTSEDFNTTDITRREDAFKRFWESVQSPEYVRAKVWSKDFVIIWSDLPEIIGQRFPDNHEVEEALQGEIEFEIEEGGKTERVSERQYEELAEVYVPFYGKDGVIAGVFEVYRPTIELNREVKANFIKVATPAALFAVLGYFLLAFALRFFLKRLSVPHETVA